MDDLKQLIGRLSAGEKSAVAELADRTEQQEACPIPRTQIDETCNRHGCDSGKLVARLKLAGVLVEVPRKTHKSGSIYFELPDMANTPRNNRVARECWELYQPTARLMQLREIICEHPALASGTTVGKTQISHNKTLGERMAEVYTNDRSSAGWTSEQWAQKLNCDSSAIRKTKTWKAIAAEGEALKRSKTVRHGSVK